MKSKRKRHEKKYRYRYRYIGIHTCLYYKLRTGNLLSEISRKFQFLKGFKRF